MRLTERGTLAGDPVEAEAAFDALLSARASCRQRSCPRYRLCQHCVIGHLEGATAIAGLLKASLDTVLPCPLGYRDVLVLTVFGFAGPPAPPSSLIASVSTLCDFVVFHPDIFPFPHLPTLSPNRVGLSLPLPCIRFFWNQPR